MGLTQNSGLDPVAQQLLGDAEIVRDLPERPAALLGQLDRLTTELLRVRGTRAWHRHHIPSAGSDRPKRSGVHETRGTPDAGACQRRALQHAGGARRRYCVVILLHCASAACLTDAIGIFAAAVRQACLA